MILSTQKQEVMRLQQESSDWSKWSQDFKGQLEQSRLALEREREERKMEGERVTKERKMEGEREREERQIEVQKITDVYHKETKVSLLSSLVSSYLSSPLFSLLSSYRSYPLLLCVCIKTRISSKN